MIPQLEVYNEKIAQLNADLDANAAQTAAVNDAAAGAIAGAQNGRAGQSARSGNVAAPMNTPQGGQSFDNTGYATIGDAYADSVPVLGQTFGDDVVNRAGANGDGYEETDKNDGNGWEFEHGDKEYADHLKDIYAAAVNSDNMPEYLASQGYRNLQELSGAIQYAIGPLNYLTFKDDVEDGRYTASSGENAKESENMSYTINPEHYETDEDYYGAIITMIAKNPGERAEILQANGYKYLADVKNDMQENGPSAYLDLKGRIEGMGYEMPKVDNGGAYSNTSVYYTSSEDYENMTGEDFLRNRDIIQKRIDELTADKAYYEQDNKMSEGDSTEKSKKYVENLEIIDKIEANISTLEQQLEGLKEGYINANYQVTPSDLLDRAVVTATGDEEVNAYILAHPYIDQVLDNIMRNRNEENQYTVNITSSIDEAITLSDKEAYQMYMDNISDTDKKDAIGEKIIGLIPGGELYNTFANLMSNLELGNKVTWETWAGINEGARSDLYDSLGGEYKMCTYQIIEDKERLGSNGEIDEDDNMVITGVAYYGEPVIVEDGTVIENPNNFVVYTWELEPIDPNNEL